MRQIKFIFVILFLFLGLYSYAVEGKITISAKDTEITDILRLVSQQAGVNIVPDSTVKGRITIEIKDVTLEEALSSILEVNGYTYKKKGNTYLVSLPRRKGGRLSINTDGKTLSCDLKNADLRDVLKEISDQAKIDLVVYGTITGTIDAKLTSVEFDKGLTLLLGGTKYTVKKTQDNIYIIGDASPSSPASPILSEGELIRLKYLKAEDIPDLITTFSPDIKAKVIKEENGIIVVGSQKEIDKVKEYIAVIDIKSPRVIIQALIVEFQQGVDTTLGFSVTGKTHQLTSAEYQPGSTSDRAGGFITATFDRGKWNVDAFTANLRALINQNKAKIIAKPHIATLSGYEAEINVGEDQYYEVTTGNVDTPLTSLQKIRTGVILRLKPWITENNEIIVELYPEVSNFIQISGGGKAATSQKNASTTIRVKDGEMIVIGGLIKESNSFAQDRFPILGKIPVLGYFFSETSRKKAHLNLYFILCQLL
jgi:type IV pilus assembly protein PilQ